MVPQNRQLTPKNVIMDVLRLAQKRSISVKILVELGEMFGFNSNAIRVALTRLVTKGHIESDERGFYRLTPITDPLNKLVDSWRLGDHRMKPWDQSWILCQLPKRPLRRHRSHSNKVLGFLGFREGLDHLWIRPANLAKGISETRTTLLGLGLETQAEVFRASDLNESLTQRWQQLWPLKVLEQQYSKLIGQIQESQNKLFKMPPTDAMIECFILGGQAIGALAKDPLLPQEIFPTKSRLQLVNLTLEYEQQGCKVWQDQLGLFEQMEAATYDFQNVDSGNRAIPHQI